MSVSIREKIAAKLQKNIVSDDGAMLSDKQRFLLRNLAFSKVYDGDAVIAGTQITYGDLTDSVDVRPDGTNGKHYHHIWALTKAQGEPVIDRLLKAPDKKNSNGNFSNRNSQKSQSSNGALTAEDVQNIVLDAISALLDDGKESATPTPAEGHEKVSTGKPVENLPVELNHLQVVRFGGNLFQIVTKDSEGNPLATPRFRKTISDS